MNKWLLALAFVGVMPPPASAQAPRTVRTLFEEDLSSGFAQLSVGMTKAEVMAFMKQAPQRQEVSTHLGLEIQRLVWTQWTTGTTYQVVLVAGRLVSKVSETKPLIG